MYISATLASATIGFGEEGDRRMPVLFCAHGSPMNIIAKNDYANTMHELSQSLPRPNAIAVISAHWSASGFTVTGNEKPPMIYDFYGFPQELYKVKYQPLGARKLALQMSQEFGLALDEKRGLDHGAWAVLLKLFPNANIPTIQISLNKTASFAAHYEFGKRLRRLRDEGVMIIASGNLVHNLYEAKPDGSASQKWALDCEMDILNRVHCRDISALCAPEENIVNFSRAHPTTEHYIPTLVALGAMDESEKITVLRAQMQNGNIGMNGFMTSY